MQSLDNMMLVCSDYKQGKFELEEFQSRLITCAIPENLSKDFMDSLVRFDHEIERIIYCASPETKEEQGYGVAEALMKAILLEQKRMD